MRKLKVCFIGIGSIAKRHIGNLSEILKEKNIVFQIDAYRTKKGNEDEMQQLGIEKCYYEVNDVPSDYDIMFITNPTRCHYETLQVFGKKAKHFFIEKPVFDDETIDISTLNLNENSIYYVACPLRYTNVIQYLKQNIDFNEVYSIRCISSSYLPDWRHGIDYRDTYSAKRELGGGVSIDLIHEWDYLQYLVGAPDKVFSVIKKVSDLEIDSDDIAIYIASYKDKVVELHLDYFGRESIRRIEMYTKRDTIIADLINSEIHFAKEKKVLNLYQERNDYQKRELESFLDMIFRKQENSNPISKAQMTLKLTKGEMV